MKLVDAAPEIVASDWQSHTELLVTTAPDESCRLPMPVNVVAAPVPSARVWIVLTEAPMMLSGPRQSVAPLPDIVPPLQFRVPENVTMDPPVRIPPVMSTVTAAGTFTSAVAVTVAPLRRR